ncbi:NAD(P)H-quinone oxidoreductase subunit N [Cyanobacterium aponinum UTEX 3222]|uniref:NAD(P)H-quinone oxidoreductase subunit N n=1 Tax=Cyanobacterium aponinum AL20115 TaxID=3090662 RepID=A0AAF1C6B0_9CHRO|nr:NAD(P)H-quinone oxidoreductase subunit N [Cyanobacterium aponinum]WRL41642.1 NAD(P)H-quinone oxidoreductase subunit N [Cyanobacterium aponinum UTEX 3222]MBD2393356.1 NAD(P)H-quinone oxidoreductase subunit N [Cyanobacterium aponinum FACHB-4101]PHV63451.1 NAD(P)H-quinone oxidoreductase [Cyanobacterium aponinum IPPAS B-1201]WPF89830.1 NAD(P)H-quinone oxidoreductase subunit N [Cyanobacterium aponinum AL20115]WRL37880.1 NAD(P)H-quinone oxidoreductase subunit N [Cyanobacterium aponinum UTEX 3221]
MPLLTTGKAFIKDLEKAGSVAVYAPLEGGFEGRYQRRLRSYGYQTFNLSARGLGDLSAYLMNVHGVRPPHLGKKNIGQEGAVGPTYFVPPIAGYQLENLSTKAKGLVLWIIEGFVLSRQEKQYLVDLTKQEPKIKVVLELGGDRFFRWQSLSEAL